MSHISFSLALPSAPPPIGKSLAPMTSPQRILVLGSPGSGKSTLAKQISARLSLPIVHLDQVFWTSGWVQLSKIDFEARCVDLVSADCWVNDGNFSSTLHIRLPRATHVIFLDLPRITCIRRALSRIATHRGQTRPDMAPGCPERFDFEFLRYIWTFPTRSRPRVLSELNSLRPDQTPLHFTSHPQSAAWLATLPKLLPSSP